MGFNELNSVEHYIIHQLSGLNLNTKEVQEPASGYGAHGSLNLLKNFNEVLMKYW